MNTLSIPRANAIAPSYHLAADSDYTTKIATTLLDAGLIGDECVRGTSPRSFAEVCRRAIAAGWTEVTAGLRTFNWHLHVLPGTEVYSDESFAFVCVLRPETYDQWPVLEIGPRIMQLESTRPGLGQTVLALLYDAFDSLPNVFTPRTALWTAEYVHWHGERDEAYAIEELLGWMTPEEAQGATVDVFRRADFFCGLPEWAALPERVLTVRDIEEAARSDEFAASVVAACDAISDLAMHDGPLPSMAHDAPCELIGVSAFVRWHEDDAVLRLWDDYANLSVQGEHLEACAAVGFDIRGTGIADWIGALPQLGELARRVEVLLDLVGERRT